MSSQVTSRTTRRVYRDKVFVEPGDVNEALTGCGRGVLHNEALLLAQQDISRGNTIDSDSPTGRFDCDFRNQTTQRNAREGPWDVIKISSTTGKDKEEGEPRKE